MTSEEFDFLLRDDVRHCIAKYKSTKLDPLQLSGHLKDWQPAERQLITAQIELAPKTAAKTGLTSGIICDSLALQQASACDISRYKAGLFPEGATIADLCCGMGGDSFFLPTASRSLGVDLDAGRCRMFRHNLQQCGHDPLVMQARIPDFLPRADFFLLDPARRSEGEKHWDPNNLQPGLNTIFEMAKSLPGMLIKLPPGLPYQKLNLPGSLEFLGARRDCRELLLRTGSLQGEEGTIAAVDVSSGKRLEYLRNALLPQVLVREPGTWLCEPARSTVRSGLFLQLAKMLNLQQLDNRTAYLTTDEQPEEHPFLESWEILGQCRVDNKEIGKLLKNFDIGKIRVKKRGVNIDPAQIQKKYRSARKGKAVLFFLRVFNRPRVVLCKESSRTKP